MSTPMTSENWSRFVLPIVRREWFQALQAVASPAAQFYGIENSTAAAEYSQGIGDFGLVPEYNASTALGTPGALAYDSFAALHETTFTHKEYAKAVAIERKLWDDNQTGQIRRRAQTLGNAFGKTIAAHQSSLLNNAFSSSVLGGDGVALCSTAHPLNVASASTYSNKGTTALSYAAIVATLQAGKKMADDRGNVMPVFYDTLYVPVELEATAYEQTASLLKPGTNNNDASYLSSAGLRIVADPFLIDANNWYMLSSEQARMHALWYWRTRPEIALDPSSDFNLVARYRGYMRYSYGWDDARFIYGHEVA